MPRFILLLIVGVSTFACRPERPVFRPFPCGVATSTGAQALRDELLVQAPTTLQVRISRAGGGDLLCTPGVSEECRAQLLECAVDVGDVPLGELIELDVAIPAPDGGFAPRFAELSVDVEACPDVYVQALALGNSTDIARFAITVRPSALGACDTLLRIASDADNVAEGTTFDIPVRANGVPGAIEPGCRTEDACCCAPQFAPSVPRCSESGHVECAAASQVLFDARCEESGLRCSAGGDSAAAIVRLDASTLTPRSDVATTITWDARNATSCLVMVDGVPLDDNTSGSTQLFIDREQTVVAICEPSGAASTAALRLAPACDEEVVIGESVLLDADGIRSAVGEPFDVRPTDCVVVDGAVRVVGNNAALAARIVRAELVSLGGSTTMDFVALVSAEVRLELTFDRGPPRVEGLDVPYVAFPSLTTAPDRIVAREGRLDVRVLRDGIIEVNGNGTEPGPGVIDFGDDVTLSSFMWQLTTASRAPIFTGSVARVTGDVTIFVNELLAIEEVDALIAQLGTIEGTITTCGNFGDDPC